MSYITNINNPDIQKVIALSDIHGDIQAFIIALRDCAKVIKKKRCFNFTNDIYDYNLEEELNKDLNDFHLNYQNDLNYEWIGGNTHVVICGDIIDPYRTDFCKKTLKCKSVPCNYYPQIELKILMFINAINKQALTINGQIIKLLGNHELSNILENTNVYHKEYNIDSYSKRLFNRRYIFPTDKDDDNYYNNISRTKIFNVGQIGFNLLFEGGCGILVKINNILFVHGGLANKSFKFFDNINQWINDPLKRSNIECWHRYLWNLLDENSPLWIRTHNIKNYSLRIKESNNYCNDNIINEFNTFLSDLPNKYSSTKFNLKLVVGHCIQSELNIFNNIDNIDESNSNNILEGITYKTVINHDNISDTYTDPIFTGVSDSTDQTKIFGITMECLIPSQTNNYRIYKVDIGMSRAFDNIDKITSISDENKYFYSKTPQVLVIESKFVYDNYIDNFSIVKSTIKNTRIHLPRPMYEQSINSNSELNLIKYTNKYLKYKNKYLNYKNK